MKLASYIIRNRMSFGAVIGDGIIDLKLRLARFGTLQDVFRAQEIGELAIAARNVRPDFAVSEAQFLPPMPAPEKIICVGVNYANRNEEYKDGTEPPRYPSLFFRTPGSLVGHGQPIIRPKASPQLDYEGEIVLVIGREGRHVPKERALELVAGITLCNEGTVRDWLRHGKFNVTQGKNFERSGSIGPWIVTGEVDLTRTLHLMTRVNEETRQNDTTANLIFSFADLIAYITTFTMLKPGDLIVSGTPTGAGARFDPPRWLEPGDTVEVEVPEIGVLRNVVMDETDPPQPE
jgi:2-keto-4-pentenoate hydratase/2-oxohepta-3-ene-1,7-dioic acid hydratase in catechol pathway